MVTSCLKLLVEDSPVICNVCDERWAESPMKDTLHRRDERRDERREARIELTAVRTELN